jgi:hypothetical protein
VNEPLSTALYRLENSAFPSSIGASSRARIIPIAKSTVAVPIAAIIILDLFLLFSFFIFRSPF